MQPACFTIHGPEHLRAALAAGASSGRPVVALSAEGAAAYAGAGWFKALAEHGAADFPDVPLTAILDCGDRAGDALAALNAGVLHIVFNGHPKATASLAAIADGLGATVHAGRPESCDLLNAADPEYAARRWCEAAR